MGSLPRSPAAERNKDAILEQLTVLLSNTDSVLEIGAGTGQHAVYFAPRLPHLTWQPTDVEANVAVVRDWVEFAPSPNLELPMPLDVTDVPWPVERVDAVYSANTAHIMHWVGVCAMFAGVGRVLSESGLFLLYGPFFFEGGSVPSNDRFDRQLRQEDPGMGVRRLEELRRLAGAHGLGFVEAISMPANNHLAVFSKQA